MDKLWFSDLIFETDMNRVRHEKGRTLLVSLVSRLSGKGIKKKVVSLLWVVSLVSRLSGKNFKKWSCVSLFTLLSLVSHHSGKISIKWSCVSSVPVSLVSRLSGKNWKNNVVFDMFLVSLVSRLSGKNWKNEVVFLLFLVSLVSHLSGNNWKKWSCVSSVPCVTCVLPLRLELKKNKLYFFCSLCHLCLASQERIEKMKLCNYTYGIWVPRSFNMN